jgi:DNA-binding protein H-NS
LEKRLPSARRELEKQLNALSDYIGGKSRGRKADGRSKLKGRKVAPKYRGKKGETWSGRGLKPRWLSAAIKSGADLEDFAIGTGGRGKKRRKVSVKSRKKRIAAKRAAPKRKAAPKRRAAKTSPESAAPSAAAEAAAA